MDTLNLRQRILLNQPHIESVKDDLINFTTDMKAPLKECKVYFEPVQEGSGDPSPDNVRNITGWDEVEVPRCGKNLFDISKAVDGYVHYYGTSVSIPDAKNMTSDFIPICEGNVLSYQVYPTEEGKGYWTGYCFYGSQNMTDTVGIRKVAEGTTVINNIIVPAKAKYIRIGSRYLKGGSAQLELSATTTQYEQYQGEIKTVNWADDIGTIYGGYVDLVKGELVAEWIKFVFDRDSKVSNSGTSTIVEGLTWMTLRKTISSALPYMVTPNDGDSYGLFTIGDWQKAAVGGRNRAFVNSKNLDVVLTSINGEDLTTSEGRNTFFDYIENNNIPIECIYKLAEPIYYSLTPQQLLTFKGTNNIWSNSNGQIEVKFWTHIHNESESDQDDSTSNIVDTGLADSMVLAS